MENDWLRERFGSWSYLNIAEWILCRSKTCTSQEVAWAQEFMRVYRSHKGDE